MKRNRFSREIQIPLSLLLAAFFFLFYLATLGSKPGYATDSNENFRLSLSILRDGNFFPETPDTRIYHGYAYSVLPIPFYLLGETISAFYPERYHRHILRTSLCIYNMAVTALTLALLYSIIQRLGFKKRTSVTLVLGLGLGTLVFPYARYDFNQPSANLFMVAQAFFLLRWLERKAFHDLVCAGLCLGLALWSRTEYGLLLLPMFATLVAAREKGWQKWLAATFPCFLALVFVLVYNSHYWGADQLLMGGYGQSQHRGSPLEALWGIFLSPGKSAFLYSPLLLLSLPALPLFLKRTGYRGGLWLLHGACVFILYCFAFYWWGGWCWGPRLILPLLPALILSIGVLLEWRSLLLRRLVWLVFILLAVAGFAIQGLGILHDFNDGLKYQTLPVAQGGLSLDEMTIYTTWSHGPLMNHARLLQDNAPFFPIDLAVLALAEEGYPSGFVIAYTLITFGLIVALVLLIYEGYIRKTETME